MGADAMGNRYYENRVDYPLGQHRWVEPADIHNFDSTHVPPEWHCWMTHVNDATPTTEQEYIDKLSKHIRRNEISHAPQDTFNLGHQEPYFNWHGMHNQSQVRSRGYGIGNHVVNLPPGVPNGYYTQPGSPYNEASIRKFAMVGDLDNDANDNDDIGSSKTKTGAGVGRPYKNELWKERLKTAQEKEAERQAEIDILRKPLQEAAAAAASAATPQLSRREMAILARGGTLAKA
jgi:NADH ubiquinone oxidoreductase subunit NDUFA12